MPNATFEDRVYNQGTDNISALINNSGTADHVIRLNRGRHLAGVDLEVEFSFTGLNPNAAVNLRRGGLANLFDEIEISVNGEDSITKVPAVVLALQNAIDRNLAVADLGDTPSNATATGAWTGRCFLHIDFDYPGAIRPWDFAFYTPDNMRTEIKIGVRDYSDLWANAPAGFSAANAQVSVRTILRLRNQLARGDMNTGFLRALQFYRTETAVNTLAKQQVDLQPAPVYLDFAIASRDPSTGYLQADVDDILNSIALQRESGQQNFNFTTPQIRAMMRQQFKNFADDSTNAPAILAIKFPAIMGGTPYKMSHAWLTAQVTEPLAYLNITGKASRELVLISRRGVGDFSRIFGDLAAYQ